MSRGDVRPQAGAIAQRLASRPAMACRCMKENPDRAMGGDFDQWRGICARTEDHHKAALAFIVNRSPVLRSR